MLKVQDINLFYGAIQALRNINFHVQPGEIVSLIGANGAGKSSILNAISGVHTISSGEILFEDQSIKKLPPFRLVGMGLSQVPEGRRVFAKMSVHENLEMGAFTRSDTPGIDLDMERIFAHFPRLKERRKQLAGTLSGGEQQMLAMGRAMMSRPKLLMMDEPSMGLSPLLVQEIFDIIREINQEGTTILLVEQNAQMALSLAHRAYVLETGRIIKSGAGQALMQDEDVRKAYLGG
ncbi:MAG: ABC transporter ATP-binding protein [Christensenellales bacterium]|jgi:branched-chain amino acid transport system ATP-binding protein|nr:ABC transporter ATP-binding protein [Clostridiales bacterium]